MATLTIEIEFPTVGPDELLAAHDQTDAIVKAVESKLMKLPMGQYAELPISKEVY
jgi:hypothetical protein